MPANDREVFQYLRLDPSNSEAENNLTYALFAQEKDEWIKHRISQGNNEPSQAEIDSWIANIADYRFARMREQAIAFFDVAARAYLKDEFEAAKKEALESAIVSKVAAAGSLWRQLGLAILTAVLAPIIIGGIIAAVLAWNQVFPTFVQVPTVISPQNGKVDNEQRG